MVVILRGEPLSVVERLDHWERHPFLDLLVGLQQIVVDGSSELVLDVDTRRLERRVDHTVKSIVAATVKRSEKIAADHLRSAWIAAYGLSPHPDNAYGEAVRAVEAVACPLIMPKADGSRTLGTAIRDLRAQRQRWEVVLPDVSGSPAGVDSLLGMLELLWQGQVSRHAGSSKSRRQTQDEAEAAVHLAGTLVHWLSTGVLRKR
jgi:hypothetical protein